MIPRRFLFGRLLLSLFIATCTSITSTPTPTPGPAADQPAIPTALTAVTADPRHFVTAYVYDTLDRVRQVIDPLGRVLTSVKNVPQTSAKREPFASQPASAYDESAIPVPSRVPRPGANHDCTRPQPDPA